MRERTNMASLDVLATEARAQLAAQLNDFDRVDAKAGMLLGFSGLFVALAPGRSAWFEMARLAAVTSAVASLLVFVPRGVPVLDLRRLRRHYMTADPVFTRVAVLDTQLDMIGIGRRLVERKTVRLEVAISALFAAVALAFAGFLVSFR